jgi:hypothetical protein
MKIERRHRRHALTLASQLPDGQGVVLAVLVYGARESRP